MAREKTGAKKKSSKKLGTFAPLGLAMAFGILAGLGGYTFSYAEGFSYFSTDPRACVNCHIMQSQYDSWQKASHHSAAVCVDCHLPAEFIPKYLAKSENGWRHGKLFTTGGFREPIVVQAAGRRILQDNCIRCHADVADEMLNHGVGMQGSAELSEQTCTHCHSTAGHGIRAGLGGPLTDQEISHLQQLEMGHQPQPQAPSH